MAIALVCGLAACGGSDDPAPTQTAQATTTATTSTSTSTSTNAEPKRKLSRPEYDSIRSAYRLLLPLEKSNDIGKAIRAGRKACVRITTQTALLAAIHAECMQTLRFLGKGRQLVTRKAECTRAANAGDISCFAELFRGLGRSARVDTVRSAQLNAALRRRRIGGACARAIGSSKKELAAGRAVVHDALGAAHALEARRLEAFQRATARLQGELNQTNSAKSVAKGLRQLEACR
jgi:hypothetical protein